jgi:hypothetical protein
LLLRRLRSQVGLGAVLDRGDANAHQLELRLRIAIAVALLVCLVERLPQLRRIGSLRPLDGELERLAPVAQVVGDLDARSGQLGPGLRGEFRDRGSDRLRPKRPTA